MAFNNLLQQSLNKEFEEKNLEPDQSTGDGYYISHCYEEDEVNFMNRFHRLKKDGHVRFYTKEQLKVMFETGGFEYESEFTTQITYSRRYNEHYIRLIKEMPRDILSRYNLTFINDKVFVTVTITNMKFKKIEERG